MSEPFTLPELDYRPPQTPWLNLLYHDQDILVLDKPSGLLSVPGRKPEHADSLALRVQRALPTATIVHRLDMATSGLMVMALNKEAHRGLSRQFEQRCTQKRYQALLLGNLSEQQGLIDQPLRCDWPNRPRQMIDHQQGKPAQTGWQVKSQHQGYTRVTLSPITGRSHQLRVHSQFLGHPILGDKFYAPAWTQTYVPRLQLHAEHLGFYHPSSNQWLSFDSPGELALESGEMQIAEPLTI